LKGDGKVHGEAPRGNQRVALGDRTNFEAGQVEIEGKPPVQITRRITRSFHAQLLANAQKNNAVIILDNCFSTLSAMKF
jgi:cyclin B